MGLGPVALPAYIDRAQLVYQSGTNEFQVPSKASWAGPLGENVTQVLADDLGQHLHSGNVLRYPWAPNSKLRYQVVVNVEQFHSISGQEAILDVSWLVEEPGEPANPQPPPGEPARAGAGRRVRPGGRGGEPVARPVGWGHCPVGREVR